MSEKYRRVYTEVIFKVFFLTTARHKLDYDYRHNYYIIELEIIILMLHYCCFVFAGY